MSTFKPKEFKNIKAFYDRNGYAIVENMISETICDEIKKESLKFSEPPDYPVVLNIHRKSDFFFSPQSNFRSMSFFGEEENPFAPLGRRRKSNICFFSPIQF